MRFFSLCLLCEAVFPQSLNIMHLQNFGHKVLSKWSHHMFCREASSPAWSFTLLFTFIKVFLIFLYQAPSVAFIVWSFWWKKNSTSHGRSLLNHQVYDLSPTAWFHEGKHITSTFRHKDNCSKVKKRVPTSDPSGDYF